MVKALSLFRAKIRQAKDCVCEFANHHNDTDFRKTLICPRQVLSLHLLLTCPTLCPSHIELFLPVSSPLFGGIVTARGCHRSEEGIFSRYDKEECVCNECDTCKDFQLLQVCTETNSLEQSKPVFKVGDFVHFKIDTNQVASSNDGPWYISCCMPLHLHLTQHCMAGMYCKKTRKISSPIRIR